MINEYDASAEDRRGWIFYIMSTGEIIVQGSGIDWNVTLC
jgi:hypothetical protein